MHPNVDKQDAFHVVDEIRKTVETTPYSTVEDNIGVTFSAGVADTFTCMECPRIDDFIGMADKALYRAKDTGRV